MQGTGGPSGRAPGAGVAAAEDGSVFTPAAWQQTSLVGNCEWVIPCVNY